MAKPRASPHSRRAAVQRLRLHEQGAKICEGNLYHWRPIVVGEPALGCSPPSGACVRGGARSGVVESLKAMDNALAAAPLAQMRPKKETWCRVAAAREKAQIQHPLLWSLACERWGRTRRLLPKAVTRQSPHVIHRHILPRPQPQCSDKGTRWDSPCLPRNCFCFFTPPCS